MTSPLPSGDRPRPLVISIIGWFFIVTGILSMISILGFAADQQVIRSAWGDLGINFTTALITTFITGIFYAVMGFGVLKGHTWGRTAFIIFGLVSVTMGIIYYHQILLMAVPTALYYGIFIWLLTREPATAWFDGSYQPPPEEREQRKAVATVRAVQKNTSVAKQFSAILFALAAGFLFAMAIFMFGFAPGLSVIVSVLFFGIPAVFILTGGVFLWGRGRWAVFSGWTITAAGCWAVLSGGSILVLMHTTMWSSISAQMQSGNVTITVNSMSAILLAGIFAVILGIGLINHQYKMDNVAIDDVMRRKDWDEEEE